MRSFASLTILGTFTLAGLAYPQSLAEHSAAAAGATIGTAAGKPLSNALGKIFGDVDKSTTTAAGAKKKATPPAKATITKPEEDSAKVAPVAPAGVPEGAEPGGGIGPASAAEAPGTHPHPSRASRARPTAETALAPIAPPPPAEPVTLPTSVKEPSAADFGSLHVGATEKEMIAALGVPESRVSIPDDDGHLRETCQYWAQGSPLGTVRLDNGQVVQVVVRNTQ